jgi:ATP-dependent Clp protease adapter protein ClpS
MAQTLDNVLEITSISLGRPHKTILFNDDSHYIGDVIAQVMKAISCDRSRAYEITNTAHKTGSAVVITANFERCEHVASILEATGLLTKIEGA